jgi:hypothetical protein
MSLALYTTVYPGVERFLPDWYRSVMDQTDTDFLLWIGVDGLEVEAVLEAMGGDPRATWVSGAPGDTPAQIRHKALARIVDVHDAVVLVDSDDVLHTSRVAAARVGIQTSDVAGCALRLVDERGQDLGMTFGLPPQVESASTLPRNNVFGLSNTAFRSEMLRRCLPIPVAAVLVDWLLITRAWLLGARMAFDPMVRMDYRQHGANTTHLRPPYSVEQVAQDTRLVRQHFRMVQGSLPTGSLSDRVDTMNRVAADIEAFHRLIVSRPKHLERYARALNDLEIVPLWWSCVAYPSLQHLWDSQKETK